jgi:hypothetical protein
LLTLPFAFAPSGGWVRFLPMAATVARAAGLLRRAAAARMGSLQPGLARSFSHEAGSSSTPLTSACGQYTVCRSIPLPSASGSGGLPPSVTNVPYPYLQLRNRNPRNDELLGCALKPRGFDTVHKDVTFFHRSFLQTHSLPSALYPGAAHVRAGMRGPARLRLHRSNKHITAFVDLPSQAIIVTATYGIAPQCPWPSRTFSRCMSTAGTSHRTQEYNVGRHLYSYSDRAAAMNIARVMGTPSQSMQGAPVLPPPNPPPSLAAKRLHESGIHRVKFVRGDAPFHGRVKLFIETLKSAGILLQDG